VLYWPGVGSASTCSGEESGPVEQLVGATGGGYPVGGCIRPYSPIVQALPPKWFEGRSPRRSAPSSPGSPPRYVWQTRGVSIVARSCARAAGASFTLPMEALKRV